MAALRSIYSIFLVASALLEATVGLYEDQIGKFDWKQSYVGNIRFASFDSAKRVVVGTDENVLASLNLKNGQMMWRQVLEDPKTDRMELLYVDKEIVTVSGGESGWYVRGWDLNSGAILWEWMMRIETDNKANWVVFKDRLAHIMPVVNSHLEVTYYDVRTGRNDGKTSKIAAAWISDLSRCTIAGTYWSCISNSSELIYIDLVSQSNKVYNIPTNKLIGNASGTVEVKPVQHTEADLLLIRNNVARYIRLQPEFPRIFPYGLKPNVAVAPNGDQTLLLQFENKHSNDGKKTYLHTIDLEEATENLIETDFGKETEVLDILVALCRGTACRILSRAQDISVSLLQLPGGKTVWTRQEALHHIVATEFLELPVSELDASIEHEFDSASGDIFGTLYHRLVSQARQLSVLLTGQQGAAGTALVRDEFGLHKLIVVATYIGKLFALDSLTGEVVWSRYFPGVQPFVLLEGRFAMFLFVQRTARYAPLPAQCVLLMKEKTTGHGILYTFDPITGQELQTLKKLPYRVEQAMLLPYEDDEHLKGLIILSKDNQIDMHPVKSKSTLMKHANSVFLCTIDSSKGVLHGFHVVCDASENLSATPVWSLSLGEAEIVAMGVRPVMERVHSQGRVLADRSVLYKYVNPNLLALATVSNDPTHKHVLSVHLIDGITGLVVYSAAHKRVGKPVGLVHSENWLVYSYYNERHRRTEIAAIELYEGAQQSNRTAFSSHAVSWLPRIETQAYIFPGTPLAMQATITERGITNKHILMALSSGAVVELPWAFLEPRGPQGMLNPEEGYIPYMPELPIPSEATINYNQSLARVRGVQVAPARLESTCLVLVHGLDLYYTRVTPSKTFDMLKEDFDHWLIAVVLVGLVISSCVTKRLASRKALKQAWK